MSERIPELIESVKQHCAGIAQEVARARGLLELLAHQHEQFLQTYTLAKPSHTRKTAEDNESTPWV